MKKSVSVILVAYNKFENFEKVIKGWLNQPEVDDIIILDNSGTFKTELPVLIVNVSENLNVQGKFPLAFWAKHDCILLFDDDILPKAGLVADFLKHWTSARLLSLIGRKFSGDTYYEYPGKKGSRMFYANKIEHLQKVEWVGAGACMVHRRYCAYPIKKVPEFMGIEDLWWEKQIRDKLDFYVIPSNNWENLPEQKDPKRAIHLGSYMGGKKKWEEQREKYAKKWGFVK